MFDLTTDQGLASVGTTKWDDEQVHRLLAAASIAGDESRSDAAKVAGVSLQIVRDWVMRFNERGPDGLGAICPPEGKAVGVGMPQAKQRGHQHASRGGRLPRRAGRARRPAAGSRRMVRVS